MMLSCVTFGLALAALCCTAGEAAAQVTPAEGDVYPVGTVVTGPCAYSSQPPAGTDVGAGAQHVEESTWTIFSTDPGGGVIGDVWPHPRLGCLTRGEPHGQLHVGVIILEQPGRYTMTVQDSRILPSATRKRVMPVMATSRGSAAGAPASRFG